MSSSIGSVTSSRPTAAPDVAQPKPGNLDAEKAKCERQLADWVHCVSATTPTGKAKIAELSARLSQIDTQIKKADDDGSRAVAQLPSPSPSPTSLSPLGAIVDVHA